MGDFPLFHYKHSRNLLSRLVLFILLILEFMVRHVFGFMAAFMAPHDGVCGEL